MACEPHIARVFAAVNIGSFRVSAMIAGISESGEMTVLGSGHRAAQGIKRGYVTDMAAATYAVRDALERAEKLAGLTVQSVWLGASGAGLASRISQIEIEIGGRRIEEEDIEQLLAAARDALEPDGRMVLHAQPACYFLDGAEGIANPKGLHAERLGVDIHTMLADGAPMRNLREAVENAHLEVEGIVADHVEPAARSVVVLGPPGRQCQQFARGVTECVSAGRFVRQALLNIVIRRGVEHQARRTQARDFADGCCGVAVIGYRIESGNAFFPSRGAAADLRPVRVP